MICGGSSAASVQRAVGLSVLLAVVAGCQSGLVFEVEDESVGRLPARRAEIVSGVVPPGAQTACPGGRLLIAAGLTHRPPDVFGFSQLQAGTTQNLTSLPAASLSPSADDRWGSNDILMTRLPGSGLLMTAQSSRTTALTPEPDWWNDFAGHSRLVPGERVGQSMWRTFDCGQTWVRLPGIDPALVLDGDCARPQPSAKFTIWRGGFDRSEIHVNPWRGEVFLTAGCMSGGINDRPGRNQYLLFVSRDHGSTWKASGPVFPRVGPLVMTSTPSGRLFLLHCTRTSASSGYRPVLYWTDPPWETIGGSVNVLWDPRIPGADANACVRVETLPVEFDNNAAPTLARAGLGDGSDLLRVAFPGVEDGRQVERVTSVVVAPDGAVTQLPRLIITAGDPKGSVLHATFVETNRWDFPAHAQPNVDVALLYWLETVGSQLLARGILVDRENRWTEPFDLSEAWTPNPGDWSGHYMKGTFYYTGGKGHFVAVWPVPAHDELRYATVVVEMPLKSVGGFEPLYLDPDELLEVPVPYTIPEDLGALEREQQQVQPPS